MMKRHIYTKILFLLTITILAVSCTNGQNTTAPNQSAIEQSVSATLTSIAPSQSDLPAPTPETAAWLDTATPAAYTLPPELAGLVYRKGEQIWLVSDNGTPLLVADEIYYAALSPDLTRLLYINDIYEAEDMVLRNLNTGTDQQLTDTPTIQEGSVHWWPARPGVLVFNQMPIEQLGPWAGYLGAFDLASNQRLDLDMESSSYSGFALSPDGQTILYDNAGMPMRYTWGAGAAPLDIASLNFESYAAPAFSPDGQTAAFYANRQSVSTGGTQAAIVLVDLETNQTTTLHPHNSIGQRGGPEIAFSPDGQWLAVVNPGEEGQTAAGPIALWVLAVDGSSETYLGYGSGPVWSPDGKSLLFTKWPPPGTGGGSFQQDAHITLTTVGEWNQEEIVPLVGSTLLDWYKIP